MQALPVWKCMLALPTAKIHDNITSLDGCADMACLLVHADTDSLEVPADIANCKAHGDIVSVNYMLTSQTLKLMLTWQV